MGQPLKYGVIYADPGWSYDRGAGARGASEKHYRTMTTAEIGQLPVADLAADDCALVMWATMPMLPEALSTMASWGFKYKTVAFVWVKVGRAALKQVPVIPIFKPTEIIGWVVDRLFVGLGHYTRANAELCLLGTRGRPERVCSNIRQVVITPVSEHSEKPAEVRDRIGMLYGDVPKVELFARTATKGWDVWGNEVDGGIAWP